MATASTHLKLGILTLLGLLAAIALAFGLGWYGVKTDTTRYHTYFDETVQGLELGAPVKFRGVLIGSVADIQVAPDRKLVDVTLGLNGKDARRLGLAMVAPEVRASLSTQGITGVKFVDIDMFDPTTHPPPPLSFQPAEHYIPATPSLLNALEGNLENVSDRFPELVGAILATFQQMQTILAEFRDQRLPDRMAKAVASVDGTASDMRRLLSSFDRAQIPEKTATAIESLNAAVGSMNTMFESIGGDGGLVASTQRATDSLGDLGRSASGSADRLERTLRDLDDAAIAIRRLAQAIDRDPEMLLKGRAKAKGP